MINLSSMCTHRVQTFNFFETGTVSIIQSAFENWKFKQRWSQRWMTWQDFPLKRKIYLFILHGLIVFFLFLLVSVVAACGCGTPCTFLLTFLALNNWIISVKQGENRNFKYLASEPFHRSSNFGPWFWSDLVSANIITLYSEPVTSRTFRHCRKQVSLSVLSDWPEARSRMRALDWALAGIKTALLNDSSRSPNILFSICFFFFFSISNGLRYGHKQTLSIFHNI